MRFGTTPFNSQGALISRATGVVGPVLPRGQGGVCARRLRLPCEWSPAEWCTTDLSERAYDVGAVTGWILRVISHNRLEEGHHDDRFTKY